MTGGGTPPLREDRMIKFIGSCCTHCAPLERRHWTYRRSIDISLRWSESPLAPLGLEDLDIPPGYKHAAPLGLKTGYPIFTFFRDSLAYEGQPQGLPLQECPLFPFAFWNGRGNPAPTIKLMEFQQIAIYIIERKDNRLGGYGQGISRINVNPLFNIVRSLAQKKPDDLTPGIEA